MEWRRELHHGYAGAISLDSRLRGILGAVSRERTPSPGCPVVPGFWGCVVGWGGVCVCVCVCWRLGVGGSVNRSVRAKGRGTAAGESHLKLGGDAMCSPRNGEAAGGDAAPPPRPPLSRSAILPHSPVHPGGARCGGSGEGGGGEGGGGAARGLRRRRGAPAGRTLRAHLRRAVRGSGPHTALGTGASTAARAPGPWLGSRAPRPRPAPGPASPAPPALSEVLKSRPLRPLGLAQPYPKSYTDSSLPLAPPAKPSPHPHSVPV